MENKTTEVFGANVERLPLKDLIKKNWTGVDRNGNCDRPRGDHHSSDAGQQFRIYADLADHTDCFYGNHIYDGDKPAGDRDGNADHSCNP